MRVHTNTCIIIISFTLDNISMKRVRVLNVAISLDEPHAMSTTQTDGILEK
uniref:Uncharacterized protein n=1 Tax=Vitis vinifera TaxID=29760 RepID=F6HFZ4_VITVI